jgi:hypothetical protein
MFPNSVALGIPGVALSPGDHICAFYPGAAERDEILFSYLSEGLVAGEKCICVVDSVDPETVLSALRTELDVGSCLARHQLDVKRSQETHLSGRGLAIEAMLDFWDRSIGGALAGRFSFARAVVEMTWALRQMPGVEELVEYEARLNKFLPRYPQVFLCLYDLDCVSGDVVMEVLRTHPKVLLGGMVLDNPYYLEPNEFLGSRH